MGIFDRSGGPMDFLRNRIQSWQAHPFQNIASTAFGAFVPGGGLAANALFDRYNNNQFNNSTGSALDRGRQEIDMDTNSALSGPLQGPLGQYDRSHPYGDTQTGQVMGSGGGTYGGGPSSYSGPQNWNFGYGSNWATGNAPSQPSSFVNDILNSISTGPGQPGTQQGGLFDTPRGPEARREGGMGGYGRSANYGISPMQANGQNLIVGMDPNQMVMANGRRNMY